MQFKQIKNDIMEALAANKPKTAPYDTEAQVVRVEGSTAWVHIPGGVDETPVALTINASAGDTVRVRVGNGTAWLVGNDSAPPTDDKRANLAIDNAGVALQNADAAYSFAATAHEMAERTDQHFFVDTDGAHVTVGANTPNQGKNLLMTNIGVKVRNDTDVLAEFGADLVRVGTTEDAHVDIKPGSTTFYGSNGSQAGKIANATTYYSISGEQAFYDGGDRADIITYSNTTQNYTLNYQPVKNPSVTTAMLQIQVLLENGATGTNVINEYVYFNADGTQTFSTFPASVTYTASNKRVSIAFGDLTTVIPSSWTEGCGITIRAYYYRSEDTSNYAFGGGGTAAVGKFAYAGGYASTANAPNSHAHGKGLVTAAADEDITVVGRYNRYASNYESDALFAVGNGTSNSARSDAFQVESDGSIWTARGWIPTFREVFGVPYNTIGENVNLNTVVNPGNYYCTSYSVAATQTNAPFSNSSYQMLVFAYGGNQRLQIAWQNSITTIIRYRVRTDTSSWGAWQDVLSITTANSRYAPIVGYNEIGTLKYNSTPNTTSIPANNVLTNLNHIELGEGIWAVTAHASFQANNNDTKYRRVAIGASASDEIYGNFQITAVTSGNTNIQTTRYITCRNAWQNIYLNVASSGACTLGSCIIEAVCVKGAGTW